MSSFYCIHCGQHIDSSPEWEGLSTLCPTCGGEIVVPCFGSATPRMTETGVPPPPPPPPPPLPPHLVNAGYPSMHGWEGHGENGPSITGLPVIFASLGAGVFCVITGFVQHSGYLPGTGGGAGMLQIFFTSAVMFIVSFLIACVIGLVAGGVAVSLKKSFQSSAQVAYGLSVMLLAAIPLVMLFIRSGHKGSDSHVAEKTAWASPASFDSPGPKEKENVRKSIEVLQDDVRTFFEEGRDENGFPKPLDRKFQENPDPKDIVEKTSAFTRGILNDMAEIQRDYLKAIEASGSSAILDPKKLKGRTGYADARESIRLMYEAIDETEAKTKRLFDEMPEKIKKYGFSRKAEIEILDGIDNGLKKALPDMYKLWGLERDTVNELSKLVELLETGKWIEGADGQFIFMRDEDADTFNACLEAMAENTAKQQEMQKRKLNEGMERLDQIKESIPR